MLIRKVLEQNVRDSKLPSDSRVSWENGTKGNGICIIHDDAEIKIYDKGIKDTIILSGLEYKAYLKEVYGQDYVEYNNNEPDFYPFVEDLPKAQINDFLISNDIDEKATGDFYGCVTVDIMESDRSKTFSKATAEAAEQMGVSINTINTYMEEHNLTWHECGDRKHIIMIPSDINKTFAHSGGIAMQKNMKSFLDSLNSITKSKMTLYKK